MVSFSAGSGLPTGVYLYTVTVQTPDGVVRSERHMLIVKN